jgi:hypothetical protein
MTAGLCFREAAHRCQNRERSRPDQDAIESEQLTLSGVSHDPVATARGSDTIANTGGINFQQTLRRYWILCPNAGVAITVTMS